MSRFADRLWQLSRPAGAPWVASLPVIGFYWAHWNRGLPLQGGGSLAVVVVAWLALHAGTLWLNAALDRDEGEVLMGRAVVPPPGLARWGHGALGLSVVLAAVAAPHAGLIAGICAALAVLYSHPDTAWKAHPVLGPATNIAGYGVLSPAAGWVLVGTGADPRTWLVLPILPLFVAGSYLAAQAFQEADDLRRGYRTFVAMHGPRPTLMAARLLLGAGYGWSMLLAAAGWFPRLVLVCAWVPFWVDRWLARWSAVPGGGDERWARGLMHRMIGGAGALLGAVFLQYAWASAQGLPPAGLGTAAGVPVALP